MNRGGIVSCTNVLVIAVACANYLPAINVWKKEGGEGGEGFKRFEASTEETGVRVSDL